MATMFRAIPKSEWSHPNVMKTKDEAETYLSGLVDGGDIQEIDVDMTPLSVCRVERSYASDRQVLLITEDVLANAISDCKNWKDIEATLAELASSNGADVVGVLTQHLGTDGKLHANRWLDGCKIQPAKKKMDKQFYAALAVKTKSGFRVAAVRHSTVG